MKNIDTVNLSMELIAYSGESKGFALKAIKYAREGKGEEAAKFFKLSKESLLQVHRLHADIIQHEAGGDKYEINTLFIHAQDHFMSALTINELAETIIQLCHKVYG